MKRTLSVVLALCIVLACTASVTAAPAQSVADIFNAAQLTPRQSTNPTLAEYVKTVAAEIGLDSTTTSTYDKTLAAFNWVAKNIAFTEHYVLPVEVSTYIEDAAIYGFREGAGPCEVDSATLIYLLRYIGLNAQWAYGKTSSQYHFWTEVIIGSNIFAFDTYPGLVKSFVHRTSTELKQTKVGGFPHYGYFESGGPFDYSGDESASITTSNTGNMDRMDPPLVRGQTKDITTKYGDELTFTWSFPFIGEETIQMASIDQFYIPRTTQQEKSAAEVKFEEVAGRRVAVYTVKVGTKFSLSNTAHYMVDKLEAVDGRYRAAKYAEWDKIVTQVGDLGPTNKTYKQADYVAIMQEGYYLLEMLPWHRYHIDTNPQSSNYGRFFLDTVYRHGYVVVHVVK